MLELIKEAAVGAAVSCLFSLLISGLGVFYLQHYLKEKWSERESEAARRQTERRKVDVLEARLQRALGRLLFWMHDALVKGVEHANGDLEKAFADYNDAEEALKAYEQEQLAAHQDENRGG